MAGAAQAATDEQRAAEVAETAAQAQAHAAAFAAVLAAAVASSGELEDAVVAALVTKRTALRAADDFVEADVIQRRLLNAGVLLADTAEGKSTHWERTDMSPSAKLSAATVVDADFAKAAAEAAAAAAAAAATAAEAAVAAAIASTVEAAEATARLSSSAARIELN